MKRIGIESLSTFGLDPVEFIEVAAELGCGHVSLSLSGSANRLPQYPAWSFREDPSTVRRTARALEECGVKASLIEGFPILPDREYDYSRDLDLACEFGARAICAVSMDRDAGRTHALYAHIAEQADARGLITTTEACAGVYRTLGKTLAAIDAVSRPDFVLLIDTMHFFRTGSTVADLAALDPTIVGHIQLCDVPMPAIIDNYMEEALYERRAPGDGDLPLAEFLAHVSPDVPIGLEIPIRSEALAGIGPRDRLGHIVGAARNLLEQVHSGDG